MDKRVSLILVVIALCVGYLAGYFVGKRSVVPKAESNGSVAATNPHESMGNNNMDMSAKNNADMEKVHREIDALKKEIEKNPKDFDSLKKLGDIYYDIRDFKSAINYYERALKIKKDDAMMVDLATSYVNLNRVDEAINTLNKVLKDKPDFPPALYNMGIIYLHGKNDFKMAKKYWQRLYDIGAPGFDKAKIKMMLDAIDKMLKGKNGN